MATILAQNLKNHFLNFPKMRFLDPNFPPPKTMVSDFFGTGG